MKFLLSKLRVSQTTQLSSVNCRGYGSNDNILTHKLIRKGGLSLDYIVMQWKNNKLH